MELSTGLQCTCQVHATLRDNGTVEIKATAHAEYAKGCVASADVSDLAMDLEVVKAVKTALDAVIPSVQRQLTNRIHDAVFASRQVAMARGEIKA